MDKLLQVMKDFQDKYGIPDEEFKELSEAIGFAIAELKDKNLDELNVEENVEEEPNDNEGLEEEFNYEEKA